MLGSDELRAWYGPEHVELAVDRGAVGTLLISDGLFRYIAHHLIYFHLTHVLYVDRASDPKDRNRFVDMVEAVRGKGGEVCIFSSMHESGERESAICLRSLFLSHQY